MRTYPQAKLAVVLFTYELARRLQGMGVTVNCLHPGFVATNFAQSDGGPAVRLLVKVLGSFGASPQEGANTSISLASSPGVEGMTGKYFFDSHVTPTAPQATDMAVARKIWDVSTEMVHRQAGRSAISASDDKK